MSLKNLLLFLILSMAVICAISPVNAQLHAELWKAPPQPIDGKTKMSLSLTTDSGMNKKDWQSPKYNTLRKKELNTVKKIIVSIEGYGSITLKKPVKGWKTFSKINNGFFKNFYMKGDPIHKNYSIKLYDKNGKVLKIGKGKVEQVLVKDC